VNAWSEGKSAANFVAGVAVGAQSFSDLQYRETTYGPSTGFVYFAVIGDPYVTHVKVGFTSKDPALRIKCLQTGCPFKITLLGYVFGNEGRETELHDVLRNSRCEGEWFVWSEYVERIVIGELETVYP
jgi:hypothetical protein